MTGYPSDIAFTSSVKAIQTSKGSRAGYARMEEGHGWQTQITDDLAGFLSTLDMFYMGTSTANGQPYIQYRGGSPGFLKPLNDHTLAFADFAGNRQYISAGNLTENSKAFIFLVDYANQRRIKIWGTAQIVENDLKLLEKLTDSDYPGRPERAIVFTIKSWDVNCPQHIHKRYSHNVVTPVIKELQAKVQNLTAQLAAKEASGD